MRKFEQEVPSQPQQSHHSETTYDSSSSMATMMNTLPTHAHPVQMSEPFQQQYANYGYSNTSQNVMRAQGQQFTTQSHGRYDVAYQQIPHQLPSSIPYPHANFQQHLPPPFMHSHVPGPPIYHSSANYIVPSQMNLSHMYQSEHARHLTSPIGPGQWYYNASSQPQISPTHMYGADLDATGLRAPVPGTSIKGVLSKISANYLKHSRGTALIQVWSHQHHEALLGNLDNQVMRYGWVIYLQGHTCPI